jgi:hypothetical protein
MEALWHSVVNVAIVVASLIVAIWISVEKKPVLSSIISVTLGVLLYGMEIYSGYSDGACTFINSDTIWEHFANVENCFFSYSVSIAVAQVAIIGALLFWLGRLWARSSSN